MIITPRSLLITYNAILDFIICWQGVLFLRQELNIFLLLFPSNLPFILLGAHLKQSPALFLSTNLQMLGDIDNTHLEKFKYLSWSTNKDRNTLLIFNGVSLTFQSALAFLMLRTFHFSLHSTLPLCLLPLSTLEMLWQFYTCISHAVSVCCSHNLTLANPEVYWFSQIFPVRNCHRWGNNFLPLFLLFVKSI